MAMSGVVIPEMARVSGLLPNTVDLIIRDGRARGIAPMGKQGRGQTHGQFDNSHLSYLILACTAPAPSKSADAAIALSQLYPDDGKGGSLGSFLAHEIMVRAQHILRGDLDYLKDAAAGWDLTTCLDPLSAWMSWKAPDGSEVRRHFSPKPQFPMLAGLLPKQEPNLGIRRQAIIPLAVLNVAAELCADTIARQKNLPVPTAPATETENAALAGAAPTQDRNSTPSTCKREHTGGSENPQALTSRGPGFLHHTPRSPPRVECSPTQPLA